MAAPAKTDDKSKGKGGNRSPRPPIREARKVATDALIDAHRDEFNASVDAYLAERGWSQQTTTVTKWSKSDGA